MDERMSIFEALATARRAVIDSKTAVMAWMDEQARSGLVTAGQAPGWKAYEHAEEQFAEALKRLDAYVKATP